MICVRSHEITLIGEAICRYYEKSQTHKCPNYGEQTHFKEITKKTKLSPKGKLCHLVYEKDASKAEQINGITYYQKTHRGTS